MKSLCTNIISSIKSINTLVCRICAHENCVFFFQSFPAQNIRLVWLRERFIVQRLFCTVRQDEILDGYFVPFSEALLISSYVQGDDEETKMMRRSMVRYMCLSQLLVYRDISVGVRKRFPTHQSIVQAGKTQRVVSADFPSYLTFHHTHTPADVWPKTNEFYIATSTAEALLSLDCKRWRLDYDKSPLLFSLSFLYGNCSSEPNVLALMFFLQ